MKKNKLFAVLVSILMFATVFMSGCAFFKGANKLELTEMPKSTYTLTENWKADEASLTAAGFSFAIKLTKGEEVTTYVFGKTAGEGEKQLTYDNGFKVDGVKIFDLVDFSLSKAGKYTAKIKGEGAICTFVYTVKSLSENEAGFARGSGVAGDPFIVETADQFLKISSKNKKVDWYSGVIYVELADDIDLTNATWEYGTFADYKKLISNVRNLHLDGKGHKLSGANKDGKQNYVFGATNGTCEFKNIDLYIQSDLQFVGTVKGITTFDRFNAYGNKVTNESNNGVYVGEVRANVTFNNCENYCNIDSSAQYVSVFAVRLNDYVVTVEYNNCVNYANLSGNKIAVFHCNPCWVKAGSKIVINNSANLGKILAVDNANFFDAVTANDVQLTKENDKYVGKLSNKGDVIVDEATYQNYTGVSKQTVLTLGTYAEATAETGKQLVVTVKDAKVAKVVANVWYYAQIANDGGTWIQSYWQTIETNELKAYTFSNISKTKVVKVTALDDTTGNAVNGNTWKLFDEEGALVYKFVDNYRLDGNTLTMKAASTPVNVTIFLYDANGALIGGKVIK